MTYTEELKDLRRLIGYGAVRSLQSGGTLHCWRRSSPHNWWVENKYGKVLWHSDGRQRPRRLIFKLKQHSKELIITGCRWLIGSDEGAPEHSVYLLRKRLPRN